MKNEIKEILDISVNYKFLRSWIKPSYIENEEIKFSNILENLIDKYEETSYFDRDIYLLEIKKFIKDESNLETNKYIKTLCRVLEMLLDFMSEWEELYADKCIRIYKKHCWIGRDFDKMPQFEYLYSLIVKNYDLDLAIFQLNLSLSKDSTYERALKLRSIIYKEKGMYDLALNDLDKIFHNEKYKKWALDTKITIYFIKRYWLNSIDLIDLYEKIYGEDPYKFYMRAEINLKLKNIFQAFIDINRAYKDNGYQCFRLEDSELRDDIITEIKMVLEPEEYFIFMKKNGY